jgi:hypothetical protein
VTATVRLERSSSRIAQLLFFFQLLDLGWCDGAMVAWWAAHGGRRGRSQEPGDRNGDRRQVTGDRRQDTGDGSQVQVAGDRSQDTGGRVNLQDRVSGKTYR